MRIRTSSRSRQDRRWLLRHRPRLQAVGEDPCHSLEGLRRSRGSRGRTCDVQNHFRCPFADRDRLVETGRHLGSRFPWRGGEGDHEDYVAFGIDLWTKEDVEGRGEWGVLEFRCHPSIKDQYTASPPHKGVKRLNHIEGMTGDLRKEVSSATFAGACGGSSEFRLMVAS